MLPIRCLILALLLAPAAAAQLTEAQRLAACIDRIETDVDGAYEDATQGIVVGNRPWARHCAALALIAKGQAEEGAARLEKLANDKDAGGIEQRALYLAQAGNAWLVAGAPEAAIVTLTNAMKLSPRDADLHVDRARAWLTMKKWAEAGKDLDLALDYSPGLVEALRLRAETLLRAGRLEDAWGDATKAMAAAPKDVDLLVLRGRIREAMQAKGLPDPVDLPATPTLQDARPTIVGE